LWTVFLIITRSMISKPHLTKLNLECYSDVAEWTSNLELFLYQLHNLRSFRLNTILQRNDWNFFDNALFVVIKQCENLEELILSLVSSTFHMVRSIESVLRTLEESLYLLQRLPGTKY
jgi:hypothetical protein